MDDDLWEAYVETVPVHCAHCEEEVSDLPVTLIWHGVTYLFCGILCRNVWRLMQNGRRNIEEAEARP